MRPAQNMENLFANWQGVMIGEGEVCSPALKRQPDQDPAITIDQLVVTMKWK